MTNLLLGTLTALFTKNKVEINCPAFMKSSFHTIFDLNLNRIEDTTFIYSSLKHIYFIAYNK